MYSLNLHNTHLSNNRIEYTGSNQNHTWFAMKEEIKITPIEAARTRYNIALLGTETNSQLSMRVQDVAPGEGTPLHVHTEQAETFHVVRGIFRFQVSEEIVTGSSGFTVHIPKGIPHCFIYDDVGQQENGHLISVLTPGIHDGFIKNIPEAEQNGMPLNELTKMAENFGAKIVGSKLSVQT